MNIVKKLLNHILPPPKVTILLTSSFEYLKSLENLESSKYFPVSICTKWNCNAERGMDTGWGCRSETSSNLAVFAFAGREGGHSGQKESFISKCEEPSHTSRFS